MKYLIIGAGGTGGVVGYYMTKAGKDVTLIARGTHLKALNEQGHPEQAIPLINEVRSVHGDMPPMTGTSQEAVRAQIEHERMIEFPLENYRWYDLRRWGKLSSALQAAGRTGFNEDKNSFYPTPLTELNANDALK